ncbi:hypothetical protein E4U09_004535 [Claviceps aff. purpurea]|uniref:Uncharacterized protein n=1 Tax=Claviceps aff. purpurea TaxID=1967640 RepID=A0A9P7QD12_9HYPO|nr:hypothetical protein E4U09_004535 [Claviceps aff. purpurea]
MTVQDVQQEERQADSFHGEAATLIVTERMSPPFLMRVPDQRTERLTCFTHSFAVASRTQQSIGTFGATFQLVVPITMPISGREQCSSRLEMSRLSLGFPEDSLFVQLAVNHARDLGPVVMSSEPRKTFFINRSRFNKPAATVDVLQDTYAGAGSRFA